MGGESNNVPNKTLLSYLKEIDASVLVKWIMGIIATLTVLYISLSIPFYFNTNSAIASSNEKIDSIQTKEIKLEKRVDVLEKSPELNPQLKKYLEDILNNQTKVNDRLNRLETKQDNSEIRDERVYNLMLKELEHRK